MSRQRKPTPPKRIASTKRRLAQARELLAWYGPGTVQHIHATREMERLGHGEAPSVFQDLHGKFG
jgi:hypothetical protein